MRRRLSRREKRRIKTINQALERYAEVKILSDAVREDGKGRLQRLESDLKSAWEVMAEQQPESKRKEMPRAEVLEQRVRRNLEAGFPVDRTDLVVDPTYIQESSLQNQMVLEHRAVKANNLAEGLDAKLDGLNSQLGGLVSELTDERTAIEFAEKKSLWRRIGKVLKGTLPGAVPMAILGACVALSAKVVSTAIASIAIGALAGFGATVVLGAVVIGGLSLGENAGTKGKIQEMTRSLSRSILDIYNKLALEVYKHSQGVRELSDRYGSQEG